MSIDLTNELIGSLGLGSIIKQAKLKYINMFVNKPMRMRHEFSIYNIIICLYVYMYKIMLI